MRKSLLAFALLFFVFISVDTSTSQVDARRWIQVDPRALPPVDNNSTLIYSLPTEDNVPLNEETSYRYEITPNGVFAVSSNRRILSQRTANTATQSEVIITRHPLHPNILFASANVYPVYGGIFGEGVYVSTNGGANWTGKDSLTGTPFDHVGDPGPVVDKNGFFIMTHIKLNYGTGQIIGMDANYSTNRGATWSNSITLLAGSQDKNLATTDDMPASPFYGRSYCVWSRFTAGSPPIAISYTANGGISWSAATDINVSAAGHYSQGCDVATGPTGQVYVCWANPIGGSPFTEDFCGFASSNTGGTTWLSVNNNVFDMNGIRGTLPTKGNIRVNSFPRIAVDKSCSPRSGWIYIVVSQRNLAPAGTDADIVIHRSTDAGTSWSAGVRVNQDAINNGRLQYFPCVNVDATGAVNVFYYDDRNIGGAQMRSYLSRSTDGGATFTDVEVADHNFTPAPIGGTAAGYQGDYIGITSSNGKIWCNWADNSQLSKYQSWIASVDISLPAHPCEEFAFCPTLPTRELFVDYSDTVTYWNRTSPSAYGIGSGSSKFAAWNAPFGTVEALTSFDFPPVAGGLYLTFDEAYAPWAGGNVDSLIVESSVNSGSSWTILAKLWGGLGAQAGPLNTVFTGLGVPFVPTNSQWASKIYSLPVGTNKVRLRARSGFGNDIWVDNVCVIPLPAPVSNSMGLASQGMFIPTDPYWRQLDTVRFYLKRADFPNIAVDSARSTVGVSAQFFNINFNNATSGNYYKVVKHRNSIETWSNVAILYNRGSNVHFNFVNPIGQAFGNNQAELPLAGNWGMYSGEVIQDSAIDLSDIIEIYNDAQLFLAGYVITDVTGDNFVDLSDINIAFNNAQAFVVRVAPAGGAPDAIASFEEITRNTNELSEEQRQKIAKTIELMNQSKQSIIPERKKVTWQEGIEMLKKGETETLVQKVRDYLGEDVIKMLEEQRNNRVDMNNTLPESIKRNSNVRIGESQ